VRRIQRDAKRKRNERSSTTERNFKRRTRKRRIC
jgi:hypothetical protein